MPQGSRDFEILGDRQISVSLLRKNEQNARLRVQMYRRGQKLVDTTVTVNRNGTFIMAGPAHKNGILVLPMRHDIVVAAKQLVTLDHFSGGRLEIGVGIGAYREEFLALQPGNKIPRGKILDEGIPALQALLRDRVATFEGDYYAYHDVELYPKPMQKHVV